MNMVHAEKSGNEYTTLWSLSLSSTPLRYSVAIGGALVTIGNLLRILAPFFTPALCR